MIDPEKARAIDNLLISFILYIEEETEYRTANSYEFIVIDIQRTIDGFLSDHPKVIKEFMEKVSG